MRAKFFVAVEEPARARAEKRSGCWSWRGQPERGPAPLRLEKSIRASALRTRGAAVSAHVHRRLKPVQ
jgi:hypothetical protein